ncbi:glycoside hydrolase family 27 protein [Schleiferilactobacillus shenzhenensis]|uniref:Alpha-galactosidase n=1 Tax=Schleiferilactobacillus shenzhenensis LY-73 TaxID=1231336 RepID=U4TPB4_9LACO|nr:glycoside hydrolase family 27 protein [Schleiferilactobacillus shenzhenensis]ERL63738.1 alpha-galactosidase [Schleiferilactobacillus shenzhenensis LY-73]
MDTKELVSPAMGWASWNHFRQDINEPIILDTARAMADSPLAAAGYEFINLDDCWQSSDRDINGELQFDAAAFPDGAQMIDQIHALGLKVSLYSSCGPMTCEDRPGSYGHEYRDAQTFANWGVDGLKYDYCHVVDQTTDETLLNKAPKVVAVECLNQGTGQRIMLPAERAVVQGGTRIEKNDYGIVFAEGLSTGTLSFEAILSPGRWVFTVTYLKEEQVNRAFLTLQLGDHSYPLWFPRSSGWSPTGRVQVIVDVPTEVTQFVLTNPIKDRATDAIFRYTQMHQAISDTAMRRPMGYFVCEHGRNKPWEWAPAFADSYRISSDIQNSWSSVVQCYERAMAVAPFAKEGCYADPDMLEVGNGQLTNIENQTHFSLWCFLSAPLILGNDLRRIADDEKTGGNALAVVTNPQLIAIDQTRPYLPAARIVAGDVDVLVKYLVDGRAAICVVNNSDTTQTMAVSLHQLPKQINGVAYEYSGRCIEEAWGQYNYHVTVDGTLEMALLPHACDVFELDAKEAPKK